MKRMWGGLLLAILAAGCSTVTLADDIDVTLDFFPFAGPFLTLHQPYVQGASMRIYVNVSHANPVGWSVESDAPEIFRVVDPLHDKRAFSFGGVAVAAGTAQVIIRDEDGHEHHRERIDVALPDRVELYAHGLLLIGKSDAEARVSDARIRAGGTATFLSRYHLGSEELYGNGVLSTGLATGVDAQVESTFLFEQRDWLQLTPAQAGAATVPLFVDGQHVFDLPITVVGDDQVANLHILGEDESHASRGEWLVALAQGYDSSGRALYGIDYEWTVDGVVQGGITDTGLGDLYRYQYDPKRPRVLSAAFRDLSASAMIHSDTGYVDSSNNLGCAFTPTGAPAGLWLTAAALLVALSRSRVRPALPRRPHR